MRKQAIYIADSYSLNTGDIGILLSTVKAIRSHLKDAVIYVESSHPDELKKYDLDCKIFPRIFDISTIVGQSPSLIRVAKATLYGLFDSISFLVYSVAERNNFPAKWVLRSSRRFQAKCITESDIWLSSGGGFLSSYYRFELRLYGYFLARLLRKPYGIISQSIGPFFGNLQIRIAEYFLNNATFITIREPDTIRYLNTLDLTIRPKLTADLAFLLPSKATELPFNGAGKNVAICIKKGSTTYREAIQHVAQKLIDQGYNIIIISHTASDDSLVTELVAAIGNQCVGIHFGVDPREVKYIYSRCEFIVASRMHAIIFAAEQGTKWVGIAYEPKFYGLAKQLDRTGVLIDEEFLNSSSLMMAIKKVQVLGRDETHQAESLARAALLNIKILQTTLSNSNVRKKRRSDK